MKSKGRYCDDFRVGESFQTAGRTVTEADIVNFAGLSGDFHPLHVDREYAKGTSFGERIAHGLLGLSLSSGLASQLGLMEETVVAFLGLTWRFKRPVKIGDTLSVTLIVRKKQKDREREYGVVTFGVTVSNQDDLLVQEGEWSLAIRTRSQGKIASK
jgi:acyl dehydratase